MIIIERIASVMKIYPGMSTEYKKRHDGIWPEMKSALKEYGANNYSIFLNEQTNELFAFLEVENQEKYEEIKKSKVSQEWWKYMAPLMETKLNNEPITIELKEVFHLE